MVLGLKGFWVKRFLGWMILGLKEFKVKGF
jgi:hypothetical protein